MLPSWIINILVIALGALLACYIGATLPDLDPVLAFYILFLVVISTVCAVTNNFPFLLALSAWTPIQLPLPFFKNFPTFALVLLWASCILFFRLCLTGTIRYVKSYNLFILLCFAWVPIRFLMNPVDKLGSSVQGGSGVSGAAPYFGYAIAAVTVVFIGVLLNSREKVILYMRWSFRSCLVIGFALLCCAFIPTTGPFLTSMGMFAAGDIGDGIQRLVVLPGYGLFLFQAAFCPSLFRLTRIQSVAVFLFGLAMMIVGGNRSAMAAALIAAPLILLLRKKTFAFLSSISLAIFGIIVLHVTISQLNTINIPPLARSLGIFDSRIDESTGGNLSADWRYAVWQSGIDKIKEHPLIGKGFGNLPERLAVDENFNKENSTDFEVILAGGEAHNGFVVAAYAFGIPFMVALSVVIFQRLFIQVRLAITSDKSDPELLDFHALLASTIASFPLLIYAAFDMSALTLWIYIGLGLILQNLQLNSPANGTSNFVRNESRVQNGRTFNASQIH